MTESEVKKTNGWNEWAKAVLQYIDDAKEKSKEHEEKLNSIILQLALLKNDFMHMAKDEGEKAGKRWGIISGVVVTIIGSLITALFLFIINHK